MYFVFSYNNLHWSSKWTSHLDKPQMVGCNLKMLFSLNNVEYIREKSPIKPRDAERCWNSGSVHRYQFNSLAVRCFIMVCIIFNFNSPESFIGKSVLCANANFCNGVLYSTLNHPRVVPENVFSVTTLISTMVDLFAGWFQPSQFCHDPCHEAASRSSITTHSVTGDMATALDDTRCVQPWQHDQGSLGI